MSVCLVTGSAGLIGSECIRFFSAKGFQMVGIDNDMRRVFFGDDASTSWNLERIKEEVKGYIHHHEDIRDEEKMQRLFKEYGRDIGLIVHAAAQPSHDWAAKDPFTDFDVNARGTLILLEMTRRFCPDAVFVFTSTNKVYGDKPNSLPLLELETRYEVESSHPYSEHGIDESMGLDHAKHSIFGASKVAADVLVQEYGRYFGLKTVCFRAGCLTGPAHSGTQMHGFLAYLMKCAITKRHYTVFGYNGKQVRDNIHSFDLVNMFWHFFLNPRKGEVYNAGGGRHSNCSILEAMTLCEDMVGRRMNWSYRESSRVGDHVWWISDVRKFKSDYPTWNHTYTLIQTLEDIHTGLRSRLKTSSRATVAGGAETPVTVHSI